MELQQMLLELTEEGCYPALSFRGFKTKNRDVKTPVWRAHVNGAGNFWEDASSPVKALEKAIRAWKKAGKPMDGYGASRNQEELHP